jgi:centractin
VVNYGGSLTNVLSIYDGYAIRNSFKHNKNGGMDLTNRLLKKMKEINGEHHSRLDYYDAEYVKLKHCVYNPEEVQLAPMVSCELPDGEKLEISRHDLEDIVDMPFKSDPQTESKSILDLMSESINSCEMEFKEELWQNIVLTGGATMTPHFEERCMKELFNIHGNNKKIRVKASQKRDYAVWIGGSFLSNLAHFQGNWISTKEVMEHGESIYYRKTFF